MAISIFNNIYPPIIESFLPAFIKTTNPVIPYGISNYNTTADIGYIQFRIVDQQTGESVVDKSIFKGEVVMQKLGADFVSETSLNYNFTFLLSWLSNNYSSNSESSNKYFEPNKYYKTQFRFVSSSIDESDISSFKCSGYSDTYAPTFAWLEANSTYFSEWSNICLIRPIEEPVLTLKNLTSQYDNTALGLTSLVDIVGKLSFGNSNTTDTQEEEYLSQYKIVVVRDLDNTVVENSGWIYTNTDSGSQNNINYKIKYNFENELYNFNFYYKTNNGFENSFQRYVQIYDTYEMDQYLIITQEPDLEDGQIKLTFGVDTLMNPNGNLMKGHYTIRRTDSRSNYLYWEDIYNFTYDTPVEADFNIVSQRQTYYDKTVESNVFYQYAIQGRGWDYTDKQGITVKDRYYPWSTDDELCFCDENNAEITGTTVINDEEISYTYLYNRSGYGWKDLSDFVHDNNEYDYNNLSENSEDTGSTTIHIKLSDETGEPIQQSGDENASATNPTWFRTAVMSDFDNIELVRKDKTLKVKFNPTVSDFKRNIQQVKIDTIGSKYPFIFESGNPAYKSFSLGGLISFYSDENNWFYVDRDSNVLYGNTSLDNIDAVVADYEQYKHYNEIDQYDYQKEREFRNLVMDFLYDDSPMLYKSLTEGNILVRLMEVSFTPQEQLGRLVYEFSATAYEIDECNIDKLDYYNIIDKDNFELLTSNNASVYPENNTATVILNSGESLNDIIVGKWTKDNQSAAAGYRPYVSKLKSLTIDLDPRTNPPTSVSPLGYNITLTTNGENIETLINNRGYIHYGEDANISNVILGGDGLTTTVTYQAVIDKVIDNIKVISKTTGTRIGTFAGYVDSSVDLIENYIKPSLNRVDSDGYLNVDNVRVYRIQGTNGTTVVGDGTNIASFPQLNAELDASDYMGYNASSFFDDAPTSIVTNNDAFLYIDYVYDYEKGVYNTNVQDGSKVFSRNTVVADTIFNIVLDNASTTTSTNNIQFMNFKGVWLFENHKTLLEDYIENVTYDGGTKTLSFSFGEKQTVEEPVWNNVQGIIYYPTS